MTMPADTSAFLMLVVHATWQATILLILVAIIAKIVGSYIAAKWHVVLWSVPVLRFVFLIVPATSLSLFHWLPTPGGEEFNNGELRWQAAAVANADSADRTPRILAQNSQLQPSTVAESLKNVEQHETKATVGIGNSVTNSATILGASEVNHLASSDRKQPSFNFLPLTILVLVIWAFGFGLMICRWLVRHSLLTQLIKRSDILQDPILLEMISRCRSEFNIRRSLTCYVSGEISAPATCGFLRPIILLPSDSINQLDPSEAEMVIAHELSHVKRCDAILTLFAELAKAIHWFNPFVYLADKKVRQSIELATDDVTIERIGNDKLESYIELVLKLAAPSPDRQHLGILSMAGSKSKLKQRLSKLVDRPANSWMRNSRLSAVLSCTIAIILTVTGLTTGAQSTSTDELTGDAQDQIENQTSTSPSSKTANDQSPATDEDVHTASGTVVDDNGKPVAGALVLHQYFRDGENKDVQAVTDESGQFTIKFRENRNDFLSYHLWAYKKGYPLRTICARSKFLNSKRASNLEIRLPSKQAFQYRIINSDGSAFANQNVFFNHVKVPNGVYATDETQVVSVPIPDSLRNLMALRTDSRGWISVSSCTKALSRSFVVDTEQTGRQVLLTSGIDVGRLKPTGSLHGQILAKNVHRYEGTKIFVDTNRFERTQGSAVTELDSNGTFEIPAIAIGNLRIRVRWKDGLDVYPLKISKNSVIEQGKTLTLKSQTEPVQLVDVVGRVRLPDSSIPIAGAMISVTDIRGSVPYLTTNMAGNFAGQLCEGEVSVRVFSLGKSIAKNGDIYQIYEYPEPVKLVISKNGNDPYRIPDLVLSRKQTVQGMLLNVKGKPAANSKIVILRKHNNVMAAGSATTDTDGKFSMPLPSRLMAQVQDQCIGVSFALPNKQQDYGKVGGHQKLKVIRSDEQNLLLQITK